METSKKAIVLGATSGIGKELAITLAKNGYKVGITGRRSDILKEMELQYPGSFIARSFDISHTAANGNHLKDLAAILRGLDLLIISAGAGDINPELNFETEEKAIGTNVAGFTSIADWAFNYFEEQQFGHLVAISSIGGLRGSRQAPAYYASKAYQINYLEGLRQKAKKLGKPIFVTDIRPGLVDTAMAKGDGLFWVMPVEKASRQILKAIAAKQKVAYITKRWGVLAYIMKVMPKFIYDRL